MKILCDENVPLVVERTLIDDGHDVVTVRIKMPGSTDRQVLDAAIHEGRVLLTFDRDFGELIFRRIAITAPPTVYVRSGMPLQELAVRVSEAIQFAENGYFVVVDSAKIRKRRYL